MGKHSKVSSSTKWGLRENVDLRLMECLTPSVSFDTFMDNYFTYFRLITHLGVNNIRATGVLNKNYANALSLGTNSLKKRSVATLNSAHQTKKKCNFDSGWLERQLCDLHSFF